VTSFSKAISSFHKTKQKGLRSPFAKSLEWLDSVGRAFSFNKTPNKLKRAVSTMISPMTAPRVVGESSTMGRINTPSDGLRELRLEDTPITTKKTRARQLSCVSLSEEGGFSPIRGQSFIKQFNVKVDLNQVDESPNTENEDPDFRTPVLCSRPSFRDKLRGRSRAGTLSGFSRKH